MPCAKNTVSLQEACQWRWLPEAPGQLPGAPAQLPEEQRPLIEWCALTHRSPLLSKALLALGMLLLSALGFASFTHSSPSSYQLLCQALALDTEGTPSNTHRGTTRLHTVICRACGGAPSAQHAAVARAATAHAGH